MPAPTENPDRERDEGVQPGDAVRHERQCRHFGMKKARANAPVGAMHHPKNAPVERVRRTPPPRPATTAGPRRGFRTGEARRGGNNGPDASFSCPIRVFFRRGFGGASPLSPTPAPAWNPRRYGNGTGGYSQARRRHDRTGLGPSATRLPFDFRCRDPETAGEVLQGVVGHGADLLLRRPRLACALRTVRPLSVATRINGRPAVITVG